RLGEDEGHRAPLLLARHHAHGQEDRDKNAVASNILQELRDGILDRRRRQCNLHTVAERLQQLWRVLRAQRRNDAEQHKDHTYNQQPVAAPRLAQLLAQKHPEAIHHATSTFPDLAEPTRRRKMSSRLGSPRSKRWSATPCPATSGRISWAAVA